MAGMMNAIDERRGNDPHQRMNVLGLAVEDLDEHVADEAEADAVADVVRQRDADDRQERRERLFEVVQSISRTVRIMRKPTTISAPAVIG